MFGLPSQHSGFKSEPEDTDLEDELSNGEPWSPPGFAVNTKSGSGWYRHDPYGDGDRLRFRPSLSPSKSRQTSPEYQDAPDGDEDITLAANIPLPLGTDSPLKGRSPSPEPKEEVNQIFQDADETSLDTPNNYIRFALRAEVQHREPFVAFFNFLRNKIDSMTKTKSSTSLTVFLSLLSLLFMRILVLPPNPAPVPDLVKLSTLAKSFEPLIYYSENGYTQITALQETSVAVWDLGESVRTANMTSAPIIVRSLDDLSECLKTLGLELNKFFADVDSDVDSILLVMDWAKRELAQVESVETTGFTTMVIDNIHNLLDRAGTMDKTGRQTSFGKLVSDVFGPSSTQRTRNALTRTFNDFLNVLEESINNELTHSTALFALFESIDRQFLNLQRTVVRESDTQERLESELLSSLWTKLVGSNAAVLRKFEKNKQLLASVRARTVANKHLIMEHHNRLQTLKVSLETLRRKLVSPLVRRNDSTSIDSANQIENQIRGLEGTYDYLRGVREKQKSKLMEMVYGAGSRRSTIVGVESIAIEGR
ncbi:hypothetical protein UCRPC4_g03350 [Phaeomoniella chlamydospora]|uniref:Uncharacterized protein n=1 Tax=Phaeomoniella chlamydospora TaxID=158046 RepID=A0A0G2GEW8_PHACM|nr:hypothetical protein UCRPC4_g03350 [Phaeomoniella chlamydospora]